MKFLKNTFLVVLAAGMVSAFATNAKAQDQSSNEQRRTAVQAFNKARDLAQNKQYDESIDKFKEAIADAQKLDDKGADIIKLSKKQLPNIYYQKALDDYRAFNSSQSISNLDTSIKSFNAASDAAKQYGEDSVEKKSSGNVTQLMYMKSVLQFSQNNYTDALTTIDQVIARNANYAQAYYQKGLILKKQDGNFDKALAMFDQAISVAQKNDNAKIARQAQQSASSELIYRGSKSIESKKYSSAIDDLNKALKYDPKSSDAEFRLSQAYNERGDWNDALSHAQKALSYENGGRSAKAKIYFEIAMAHKGQGNFKQACADFANASYGQFKQSADHQIKYELKCK